YTPRGMFAYYSRFWGGGGGAVGFYPAPRCEQRSRSENQKYPDLNFYLCIFASGITLIPAKNVICAVNISLFPLFVLFLSGLLDTI
ncbi:hypothetical protein, partial [Citrobacter freundii]|uniref:hypothetical protein n=1 Tax=Citrobacter freundii TaxID=546 RepID=UPI001F20505A